MFERFTEKARRVIFFARYEASGCGSFYIETEHLLLGLLREDKFVANRFLGSHAAVESIRKQIDAHTPVREQISPSVDLPLSHECKRVLVYASQEAERFKHKHIGSVHLLLGLMREENTFAAQMLRERGVQSSDVREGIAGWTVEPEDSQTTVVNNAEVARKYLKVVASGANRELLNAFFDPEVTQKEYPNRLFSQSVSRKLSSILEVVEQNWKIFNSQDYTILHETSTGNQIVLEVFWEGTLATSWQSMAPGSTLRSHIAMVLEFRNGKIIEQRNYSCFDPFPGEQAQE